MPRGVHGSGPGSPSTSRPRLTGCRPSASLAGSIRLQHPVRVQPGRQRQLHDVTGARRVGVQLGHHRLHLLLGGVSGQVPADAGDPHLARSPGACRPRRPGCPDRRRPGPCPARGRCPAPGQRRYPGGELLLDQRGGRLAVQNLRGHRLFRLASGASGRRCQWSAVPVVGGASGRWSVEEVADAGEVQADPGRGRGGDHLIVPDRAARLARWRAPRRRPAPASRPANGKYASLAATAPRPGHRCGSPPAGPSRPG